MKVTGILALAFLVLTCSQNNVNLLTESDKDLIKKEIRKEIDSLIAGCEMLDMEKAFAVFSDDPGFYMIAADGCSYDYHAFITNNRNYFKSCLAFQRNTDKLGIKVLSADHVVVS